MNDILQRLCGKEGRYRATLAAKKIAEFVKHVVMA